MFGVFVAAILGSTSPSYAQSGQAILSCTPPVKNVDGTNITGTVSYKFFRGTTASSQTTASPVQTACAYTFTGLAVGTHYFSVTATVGGIESVKSAPVSKVIAPATPEPPSGLTVQQDLTAWTIITTDGAVVAVEVGQVAPGTACDATQSVLAYGRPGTLYHVPESAVTYLPGQTAIVTFASCGG